MKSLGDMLRDARERKGVSASEAAAGTRIKVQIIDDLEHDRFHRTYAPVYAKGFIKIYGDYLELDPETLLEAYEDQRSSAAQETDADAVPKRTLRRVRPPSAPDAGKGAHAAWLAAAKARLQELPALLRRLTRRRPGGPHQSTSSDRPDATDETIETPAPATWAPATPPAPVDDGAPEPDTDLEDRDTAAQPWHRRLRQAVRGDHRTLAAALVILFGLLVMLLIGVVALRTRLAPTDPVDAYPAPPTGSDAGMPSLEFTHDPPPPYY